MFFIFLKSANAYANADANANSKNANTVLNATKNKEFLLFFFLEALIGLRHYHKKFEAPRCKNEHFLFVYIGQILTFQRF